MGAPAQRRSPLRICATSLTSQARKNKGANTTGAHREEPSRRLETCRRHVRTSPRNHIISHNKNPHLYSVQCRSHPMRFDVAPNHLRFAHRACARAHVSSHGTRIASWSYTCERSPENIWKVKCARLMANYVAFLRGETFSPPAGQKRGRLRVLARVSHCALCERAAPRRAPPAGRGG